MNKDRVKSVASDVVVKDQEQAGNPAGNKQKQVRKIANQISGTLQKSVGDARQTLLDFKNVLVMMRARFSARGGWRAYAVLLTLIGAASAGVFPESTWAASPAYSLGDLSLQNGWDSGIAGNGFTNNNANSNVVTNTDAFTGTQSWRYSGSYGSPGSGTPFTPYVATVGAPNAASVFGGGLNSPVTPAGDQSIISFAFKAVAPGDGSTINIYEGNRDLADPSRTGPNLYLEATSVGVVTLSYFQLSSTDLCSNQDFPSVTLPTLAAGTWHTIKMTTTYPNVTPSNFSTYGTTTFVIDEGTGGEVTLTPDSRAVWIHPYDYCNSGPYSPGNSIKWSSSYNDYPTHQGFYIDDVLMKVINTATATTVGTFATSFEAAHSVTYDGNGNTGGSVPIDGNAYVLGDPVTVSGNTGSLVNTGYFFAGWNTAANGSGSSYAGGATFDMGSGEVTLYAIWTVTAPISSVPVPALNAWAQALLVLLLLGLANKFWRHS